MSYEVSDDHPAVSAVHGEASTSVDLPGRALVVGRGVESEERREEFLLPLRTHPHGKWKTDSREEVG